MIMFRSNLVIDHNFETAHRLPFLFGKCQSIHGHSWRVTIFVEGTPDENGIIAEFGTLKKIIREWIDKYLDHGTMLGWDDPLRDAFMCDEYKTKVFWFGMPPLGEEGNTGARSHISGVEHLKWPTVENVARMLGEELGKVVDNYFPNAHFGISQIDLQETAVNGAGYGNR